MSELKAIQTQYRGYLFRSRLEARWAVFFDACRLDWEYEPEGYDLGDGQLYLPDFLLHGVEGKAAGDLYVEVKGEMTDADARKINRFVSIGMDGSGKSKTATLVLGRIPPGFNMKEITNFVGWTAYYAYPLSKFWWPNPYNFESIDGEFSAAHPGINENGKFELFEDNYDSLSRMNEHKTERAYRFARQARFEHGAKGGGPHA